MKKAESGQVIVILLLVIVVSMSIGLSILGRSTSEITNSSRTEDSQRAFFAAEAGIERAINSGITGNLTLGNKSQAEVKVEVGPTGSQGIEYPSLLKKDFAHIWLANPEAPQNCGPQSGCYTEPFIDVYFGNDDLTAASPNKPAIEVNVVTWTDASGYTSSRHYYDSSTTRVQSNGFTLATCKQSQSASTIINSDSLFYCKVSVHVRQGNETAVMMRIRVLYTDGQKVAVVPNKNKSLPPQVKIYVSIGKAGNLQRVLRVIKESNVVPQLFDYAIFSAADITKK